MYCSCVSHPHSIQHPYRLHSGSNGSSSDETARAHTHTKCKLRNNIACLDLWMENGERGRGTGKAGHDSMRSRKEEKKKKKTLKQLVVLQTDWNFS